MGLLLMLSQVPLLDEHGAARAAIMRLPPRLVRAPFVRVQVAFLLELQAAHVTGVGAVARVDDVVALQLPRVVKPFSTHVTHVVLHARVTLLVPLQLGLYLEGFGARLALEGALGAVQAKVVLQVVAAVEQGAADEAHHFLHGFFFLRGPGFWGFRWTG